MVALGCAVEWGAAGRRGRRSLQAGAGVRTRRGVVPAIAATPAARKHSRPANARCSPKTSATASPRSAAPAASPSNRSPTAWASTNGRISQIERGKISGHDVLARYAAALGGRLHQAIYFDDGDITAIA